MSWGVSGTGRAPAVRAAIAMQFARHGKCMEPEETVRQAAATLIDAAIAAQDPTATLKVSANGSQSTDYTTKKVTNSLTLVVEPISQFIE